MKDKITNYIAFAISMVLSPYLTALVFVIITIYRYATSFGQFLPWMLTFFVFAIVIPGSYVLWLIETRKIHDIHIANIKDRKIPFLIAGISALAGVLVLVYLKAVHPVIVISVVYAINALAIATVTQAWKISVHMAMFSAVATMTVIIFGSAFWWLYLFLIPLAWARIYRKRHTIWQSVVGALMAFILTSLAFWFFGYL